MTDELKTWFNGKVEDIIARVKSENVDTDSKSNIEKYWANTQFKLLTI